jgi:N-acetyl-anhydromuramyl-L-alanine amidase AmpD
MLELIAAAVLAAAPAPAINADPIPYPPARRRQMAAYSERHYGERSARLVKPKAIVLHFTANDSYSATWNTFANNTPNRGEYPGTCAHFVIDKKGVIRQLVNLKLRCRHAIGINHTSIGIEIIQETGRGAHWADRQILARKKQVGAALRLVRWLQGRYSIKTRNVIGHAMVNDSPLFRDDAGWKNDHGDWLAEDVAVFRKRL